MVYGDDLLLFRVGVSYLYKAQSIDERRRTVAALASVTRWGWAAPEDIANCAAWATRSAEDSVSVRHANHACRRSSMEDW